MDLMSLMSNPNAMDDIVKDIGTQLSAIIHEAVREAVLPLERRISALEFQVSQVNDSWETAKDKGGIIGKLLGN